MRLRYSIWMGKRIARNVRLYAADRADCPFAFMNDLRGICGYLTQSFRPHVGGRLAWVACRSQDERTKRTRTNRQKKTVTNNKSQQQEQHKRPCTCWYRIMIRQNTNTNTNTWSENLLMKLVKLLCVMWNVKRAYLCSYASVLRVFVIRCWWDDDE